MSKFNREKNETERRERERKGGGGGEERLRHFKGVEIERRRER
jgi:hypothetical protein